LLSFYEVRVNIKLCSEVIAALKQFLLSRRSLALECSLSQFRKRFINFLSLFTHIPDDRDTSIN